MPSDHGKTRSGEPITEELIERFVEQAEEGYDVDAILERRRRGRPTLGEQRAVVESFRVEPALRAALRDRAARDRCSISDVIRRALSDFLELG